MNGFVCPAPLLLCHGSGGKLSAELLRDVFEPALAGLADVEVQA